MPDSFYEDQPARKPLSKNTVKAVLRDEPAPLFSDRHYRPYREMPGREGRLAVVRLHTEGWRPAYIPVSLLITVLLRCL
jgi:hypothetical protein